MYSDEIHRRKQQKIILMWLCEYKMRHKKIKSANFFEALQGVTENKIVLIQCNSEGQIYSLKNL